MREKSLKLHKVYEDCEPRRELKETHPQNPREIHIVLDPGSSYSIELWSIIYTMRVSQGPVHYSNETKSIKMMSISVLQGYPI